MVENEKLKAEIRELAETIFIRSMNSWKHHVKESGLSMPQLHLLMFLHHGGNRGVNEIGDCLETTSAAASQLVDRLVNAGFVARHENPDDRRGRTIVVTEKGRAFVEDRAEEPSRWLYELAARLHAEGREAVHEALKHLLEASHAMDGRMHSSPQYCKPENDIQGEV
jgi:DNA-binding MarR family transcriptional regulator